MSAESVDRHVKRQMSACTAYACTLNHWSRVCVDLRQYNYEVLAAADLGLDHCDTARGIRGPRDAFRGLSLWIGKNEFLEFTRILSVEISLNSGSFLYDTRLNVEGKEKRLKKTFRRSTPSVQYFGLTYSGGDSRSTTWVGGEPDYKRVCVCKR